MRKQIPNPIDEMMRRVEVDLLLASPGERAIIGMLGICAHLLGEIGENQERLTRQFDAVSAGGQRILTSPDKI